MSTWFRGLAAAERYRPSTCLRKQLGKWEKVGGSDSDGVLNNFELAPGDMVI